MSFWKDLKNAFSGKDPNQAFKERMQQEQQQILDSKDKEGVRDKVITSKNFFTQQIEKTEKYINELNQEYIQKKKEEPNFDFSGYFNDFNIEYSHLIRAKYSKGDEIKTILPDCSILMEVANKFWSPNMDYSDGGDMNLMSLLEIISLGILAEVDKEYFEDLATTIKEKKFQDFVINYFINSQIPDYPIREKLLIDDNKSVNFFVDILKTEDKIEAVKKLKIYLDKYYYTLENLDYEYNTHKFENGRNFYGYWCWEAGALVNVKGLDDGILRYNQFYPYDFVHWKDKDINKPKKPTFLNE